MMTSRPLTSTAAILVVAFLAASCSNKNVSRIEPDTVTDLSGQWNDTDSRLVANALIEQSLTDPWLERYVNANGGDPPTVIVGSFRNRSSEHIPVSTFVNDLENAYINSGAVTVVASDAERDQIREERDDQQQNARSDTRAGLGQELGANYVLQGELNSMQDEEETMRFGATRKEKIVFYQVDARLVDLESNAVVWAGQHKIKKYIERKPFGL
jgi:uncharacterized protein (TIGR02722 family)